MCDTPVLLCSLLCVRVRILQRSSQENQKPALTERLASSLSPRLRARGFAEAASTATVCNGCRNDAVFPYLAASLRFYAALGLGLTLPRCCSFRLLLQARVRHSQHRAAWLCSPAACPARHRNALDTDTLQTAARGTKSPTDSRLVAEFTFCKLRERSFFFLTASRPDLRGLHTG